MCNSSFESNCIFNETPHWDFSCNQQFGTDLALTTSLLCFIVGTPMHCWLLWVSIHEKIKPNLVFRLNVTILELIFCIQCIVYFFVTIYSSHMGHKVFLFLVGLCWTFRPFIHICICVEQYVAVIHPVTFLRYKSIHYRIGAAASAWLIALGNGVRFVFISFVSPNTFPDHIFFFLFCVAVLIVSFCCFSLLCALKRPGPGERNNVKMTERNIRNNTDRAKTGENHQKRKAFRNISNILVSILTCYIFLVISYFIIMANIHAYICNIVPLVLSFTVVTVFISSVVRVCGECHVKDMLFKLREQIKGK